MFGGFLKSMKVGSVEAKTINILRSGFRVKPSDRVRQVVHSNMGMSEYFNANEMAVYVLGQLIDDIEIKNDRSRSLVTHWVTITKEMVNRGHIDNELNARCYEKLFSKAHDRFGVQ